MIKNNGIVLQAQFANPVTRERGLTLVELMVAMAVGLLVLAGVTVIFLGANSSTSELQKSGKQIDAASFILDEISTEIRSSAYWGEFSVSTALMTPKSYCPDYCQSNNASDVTQCDALIASTNTDWSFCRDKTHYFWTKYWEPANRGVFKYACPTLTASENFINDCQAATTASAVTGAQLMNSVEVVSQNLGQKKDAANNLTQALIVRRLEEISTVAPHAESVYVSRCDSETIETGKRFKAGSGSGCGSKERRLVESAFFVNANNQLIRKEIRKDPKNESFEILSEGVIHMQVELKRNDPPVVNISFLVRNATESQGGIKTQKFVLGEGAKEFEFTDKYRYRVFSTTIEMTNEAGRS